MPFDPIAKTKNLPPSLRLRVLTSMLNIGIPFNRGLGIKVHELGDTKVVLRSPPRTRRRNHVGSAHACALALLGEYPAGLLVAQKFPFSQFRIVITDLSVSYEKQGRGTLFSEVLAPKTWPVLSEGDEDLRIPLETTVYNEKRDVVARIATTWQIKPWSKVRKPKPA